MDDVVAETAEADVGGDRDGGDDLQCRDAKAADEQGQPEGNLDLPQDLRWGHAHRSPGVDDRAVDGFEPGVRAREDRRDGEQDERRNGRLGLEVHPQEQDQQHDESERRQRAAAPARKMANSRPRPVWPMIQPTGMAMTAAISTEPKVNAQVLGDRGGQRE